MPLTLDIWGNNSEKGHLYIDRNNFIVQFHPNSSDSMQDHHSAIEARLSFSTGMNRLLLNNFYLRSLFDTSMSIDDPRHKITDHMCEADKKEYHYHLKSFKTINFEIVEFIFNNLPLPSINHVINLECKEYILMVAKSYFDELSISPSAKIIENEYTEEKEIALAQKTEKLRSSSARLNFPISFFESPNSARELFSNLILIDVNGRSDPDNGSGNQCPLM